MDKEILYVADPMCSWCWGFSPTIEAIYDDFQDRAVITLVVGGLRAGNTEALTEERKRYSLDHWHRVHELTHQPFDFEFRTPPGFIYDTEPACRAVVVMRTLKPKNTLAYFRAIQHAFYVGNEDVTHIDVLAAIAEPFEISEEAFKETFDAEETKAETLKDFQFAQRLGITGFPSLILNDQDGYKLLTSGYQPHEKLRPYLEAWVNGQLKIA